MILRFSDLQKSVLSYKQATEIFRVFKKPDFSEKSGFPENFMPENLWNLT